MIKLLSFRVGQSEKSLIRDRGSITCWGKFAGCLNLHSPTLVRES